MFFIDVVVEVGEILILFLDEKGLWKLEYILELFVGFFKFMDFRVG